MADAVNTTLQPSPVVESETPRSNLSAGDIAAPYAMLGRSLDKLGEGLENLAVPFAERAGSEAVTTDDQGNMTVTHLPIFGQAGNAYSRALKYSALAQADGAAKRADIEISKQHPNDPEAYLNAATQFKNNLVAKTTSQAGPEVGQALGRAIDETTTFNYRRLAGEQQETIRRNFEKDTQWVIESNQQNLLALVKSGGLETEAGRKQAQVFATNIDAALNERSGNPILSAPKSESDRVHTELGRNIEAAKKVAGLNGVLRNPAAPYQPDIETSAGKYNLDPTLLARQLYQESSFRENATSPAGAQGIAQFMPATARQYGVDVRNPQSSIEGTAHYMSDLSAQFGGNYGLALAGYNWGPQKVSAWLASGANPNAMPRETRNYVEAITGQPIEQWLRGVRPSTFAIQNLPSQYSIQGGAQKALDMIEAARTDPNVDPVQRQLNVEQMTAAYKDWHEGIVRRTNMAEVGQKARDEGFENDVLAADAKGQAPSENEIKTAPGVSYEAKTRLINFLKREDMPEPMPKISNRNAIDIFNRMGLPADDPNRISSVAQIRAFYGNATNGGLTKADEDWLEKKFADARTPGGERLADLRKQLTSAVKPMLDKSTMMNIDAEGGLRMYNFERFVDMKVDALKAQNKDPSDLFDPTKPDFIGKPEIVSKFQAPLDEQARNLANQLTRGVQPQQGGSTIPPVPPIVTPTQAAPVIPARLPGETMDDYDKRRGIRP